MILYEKGGIRFVFAGKRVLWFKELTAELLLALKRIGQKPAVIIFPEGVLGKTPVARADTKQWIRSAQELLKNHRNVALAFSVFEKLPGQKGISNTGYLVSFTPRNPGAAREMHWQAYAKYSLRLGDLDSLRLHENQKGRQFKVKNSAGVTHWLKRRRQILNKPPSFESVPHPFPRIILNGKTVELRTCWDLYLPGQRKANVLVVPAWGLPVIEDFQKKVAQHLKKRGFAVVNDVFPGSKYLESVPEQRVSIFRRKKPIKQLRNRRKP